MRLLERIAPAFAGIDTSSGALGNATNKVVHELIEIVCAAEVAATVRESWWQRLLTAVQEDGMGWLHDVDDRLDELAGTTTTVAPVTPPPMPPGTSVSKTFLDYVGEWPEDVADRAAVRDSYLMTCQTIWNATVLADRGDTRGLNVVYAAFAGQPQADAIEELIERKRTLFAAHRWFVRDFEVFERNGELRLQVAATDPERIGGA